MQKTLVAFLIGLTLPATAIADNLSLFQMMYPHELLAESQPILPTGNLLPLWYVKKNLLLLVTLWR
ncbi:hypothetical protein [Vibrio sp.]|uniref:hypothetical protein n=1 Tax=Vibrio sp. TaxID=678 RepID=UPI003AA9309D